MTIDEIILGAIILAIVTWKYRHNFGKLVTDAEHATNNLFAFGGDLANAVLSLIALGILYLGIPLAALYIIIKVAKLFWYR